MLERVRLDWKTLALITTNPDRFWLRLLWPPDQILHSGKRTIVVRACAAAPLFFQSLSVMFKNHSQLHPWVPSLSFSINHCANEDSKWWFSCQLLWNHPHCQWHLQPSIHGGLKARANKRGLSEDITWWRRGRLVHQVGTCSCVLGHRALNWVKYVHWNSCSVVRLNEKLCAQECQRKHAAETLKIWGYGEVVAETPVAAVRLLD